MEMEKTVHTAVQTDISMFENIAVDFCSRIKLQKRNQGNIKDSTVTFRCPLCGCDKHPYAEIPVKGQHRLMKKDDIFCDKLMPPSKTGLVDQKKYDADTRYTLNTSRQCHVDSKNALHISSPSSHVHPEQSFQSLRSHPLEDFKNYTVKINKSQDPSLLEKEFSLTAQTTAVSLPNTHKQTFDSILSRHQVQSSPEVTYSHCDTSYTQTSRDSRYKTSAVTPQFHRMQHLHAHNLHNIGLKNRFDCRASSLEKSRMLSSSQQKFSSDLQYSYPTSAIPSNMSQQIFEMGNTSWDWASKEQDQSQILPSKSTANKLPGILPVEASTTSPHFQASMYTVSNAIGHGLGILSGPNEVKTQHEKEFKSISRLSSASNENKVTAGKNIALPHAPAHTMPLQGLKDFESLTHLFSVGPMKSQHILDSTNNKNLSHSSQANTASREATYLEKESNNSVLLPKTRRSPSEPRHNMSLVQQTPEAVTVKDSMDISNTDNSNTGISNTDNSDMGISNTGNSYTGISNTGISNTGISNTGISNTGFSNAGISNMGNSNTGISNTGISNTGIPEAVSPSPVITGILDGIRAEQSLNASVPCMVCGDNNSGFYCGAFVCEACKKFFLRSSKKSGNNYTCSKSQSCVVTKETRIVCQYCRYKKCLDVGMCRSGSISASVASIPCRVCGASSSGYHFGAITCEGCKGFFRRINKEGGKLLLGCTKNCDVTLSTRNKCKDCRYKKCLGVGMALQGSRIGRQPNVFKHAARLEAQQTCKQESEQNLEKIHVLHDEKQKPAPMLLQEEEYQEFIKKILCASKDLLKLKEMPPESCCANPDDYKSLWDGMMKSFATTSQWVLNFAKKVPGFRQLEIEDQITLIQNALYQIVQSVLSTFYNTETKEYNYFHYPKEIERKILTFFPEFEILVGHFHAVGYTLKKLNLDDVELALFAALLLFSTDEGEFSHQTVIDEMQEKVSLVLQTYLEKKGAPLNRHGLILVQLPVLRLANIQHQQTFTDMREIHSELDFHPLFEEVFFSENGKEA